MTRVRRQGLGVCVAAAGWGVAIAAFGFATSIRLALVMLAFAGAADFISAVLRSTILLQATPDSMRGRLSGIELAQVAGDAGARQPRGRRRSRRWWGSALLDRLRRHRSASSGRPSSRFALPAFRRYEKPA